MTTCLTHIGSPNLQNCAKCRKQYDEVFKQWLATQEIKEFDDVYDRNDKERKVEENAS